MMTDIKCPPTPELRSFVLGQLPEETSDAMVEHLRHCPDCAARIETIDDAEDSLVADLRGLSPLDPSDASPYEQVALAKALEALCLAGDPLLPINFPQSIGEYEIVRPLGQGGMGSVFLARHTKLGRQVALKVLTTHRLADGRMRERFEAEMRAVGRLSHPNIVTAHDARDVDGAAVLVTEFIDGLDLGQLLQRTGPLSIANACEIVRQVAVALQYVHEQSFVHRDVKPSNIMLSRAGEVKLLDLGLARLQYGDPDHAEITATGQAMGTADYIAPEQVTDSRQVDIRSDLYALGCTLMKLLTGTAPFADEAHLTPFAKMSAHVSTPAPALNDLLPNAPVELTKLIGRMLQKNPAQRPQQPQDLMQVLVPLANGSELAKVAAQSITLPARPNQEPRVASTAARPKAWYRRLVPISTAIAAGFLGAFLGLCGGILIKIKYRDGTELTIEAPAGSQVSVSPEKPATEAALTVGATADSDVPDLNEVQKSSTRLDWSDLTSSRLQEQINHFNQAIVLKYPRDRQPPLTIEEFIACIASQPAKDLFLFDHVRESQAIPDGWILSGGPIRVPGESGPLSVWEIALNGHSGAHKIIRKRFLRPFADLPAETAASDPDSIPLAIAIDELNKVLSQRLSDMRLNVPLTEEEVIAAIYDWGQGHNRATVGNWNFEKLNQICSSRALPPGYSLKLGMIRNEKYDCGKFSIEIVTQSSQSDRQGWTSVLTIREWYDMFRRRADYTSSTSSNRPPLSNSLPHQSIMSEVPPNGVKDGELGVEMSSDSSPVLATEFPAKVEFAVVVMPEEISEINRETAVESLRQTISKQPKIRSVTTLVGTWYLAAEGISAPISVTINNSDFALLSNDPTDIIRFDQIKGHVRGTTWTSQGIRLDFDETLTEQMRQATRINTGKALAILLDDQIITAPRIMTVISKQIQLATKFTPDQMQFLTYALLREPSEVHAAESNDLEMIGIAFRNFHDAYRKLPGSANLREGGLATPAQSIQDPFSWRVAILPFIEQAELFQQYHFHEPWDSEHNLTLLDKMPEVYRSPNAAEDQPKGHTNYLGYAGGDGMLTGSGLTLADCSDGTSNTAIVAESKRSVPWTKPEDLTSLDIETFADEPLRLLMLDGQVVELKQTVAEDLLRRLFIRNDGRTIASEELN